MPTHNPGGTVHDDNVHLERVVTLRHVALVRGKQSQSVLAAVVGAPELHAGENESDGETEHHFVGWGYLKEREDEEQPVGEKVVPEHLGVVDELFDLSALAVVLTEQDLGQKVGRCRSGRGGGCCHSSIAGGELV